MKSPFDSIGALYDSSEQDLAKEFYEPLFEEAVLVDRVSCYFSSRALASYSRGLENFAHRPNTKYRLVVSVDIDEEDFDAMVEGQKSFQEMDGKLLDQLREDISLKEKDNLSMLVSLMASGVVEMKIAYTRRGIFHYKHGYAENEQGKSIFFLGSNNETAAAIHDNFELFGISSGEGQHERFLKIWEDRKPGMKVLEPTNAVWNELQKYRTRSEAMVLSSPGDCIWIDMNDDGLYTSIDMDDPPSAYNIIQKSHIKPYILRNPDSIEFRRDLGYTDYLNIIDKLKSYCEKQGYTLVVSSALQDYIDRKNLMIKERSKVGLAIKNHESNIYETFDEYRRVVDSLLVRKLRDRQMWDSFYMYTMKKCGNFSVPGSGKTSSALGTYAYLRNKGDVTHIIVIGPLNCFDSWLTEYRECFGHLNPNLVFQSRENSGSPLNKNANLKSVSRTKEMYLFNYESLRTYFETIRDYLVKDSLIVFDEVHYVKGIDAVRSRYALEMVPEAERVITMTGTPIPNTYVDLYNMLNILFPSEYGSYFNYSISDLANPTNSMIDDINKKIQPFFCRTNKTDLGVPEVNADSILHIDSDDVENELYKHVLSIYSENRFALIIRVLQLESDPHMLLNDSIDETEELASLFNDDSALPDLSLSPNMNIYSNVIDRIEMTSKTRACVNLVESLVKDGRKVIVWCIFCKSIENITRILNLRGIHTEHVYGSTEQFDRTRILNSFRNGDFDVLVTNPHTLAESVSLHQTCHDAVYFEYSYNLVHLLQSKDRIHRLGLPEGQYTQYYYNMSFFDSDDGNVSLDEQIYNRLLEKEERMYEAIDSDKLEMSTTSKEDVDIIFNNMGWNRKDIGNMD